MVAPGAWRGRGGSTIFPREGREEAIVSGIKPRLVLRVGLKWTRAKRVCPPWTKVELWGIKKEVGRQSSITAAPLVWSN
jgi:hypothetical protein